MTILAKFLAAKEPLFDHALRQLEERTGKVGVDAALVGEIANKTANHIKRLHLEPDCSGEELYAALIEKVHQHDEHLARAIGGHDPSDVAEMTPLIVKAVEEANLPRQAFALKPEVAKRMLAATPPPGIMKRLGYENVNDLLEKENLSEISLALRFAEDPDWLNNYDEQYSQLTPADFETRDIQIVVFDGAKWGDIAIPFIKKKFHNITHSKEMAVIGVMPMNQTHALGTTLKVLPLLVHYFNEIRLYSAFFKLMRSKKNFGAIIASTLVADPSHVEVVQGTHIHWRVIQRYFGRHPEGHPEIFEPHLQPEDLHWRKAEEVLYQIDPELEFWHQMDYVAAMKGDEIVPFNLMDNSFSYCNQTPYAERKIYHFRESLWNEIFARYMSQKTLEEQLLQKLDNDLIAPERLPL